MERLLGDPVESFLNSGVNACADLEIGTDFEITPGAAAAIWSVRPSSSRFVCAASLREVEDQRLHLGQPGLGETHDIIKRRADCARMTGQADSCSVTGKCDAVEGLHDRVVQFARQSLAFFERGEPVRLAVKPSILHGQRRVISDGQRQLGVVNGEIVRRPRGRLECADDFFLGEQGHRQPRTRLPRKVPLQ